MYLALKLVHLAGVVLFLGNITVGVFWKATADRSGDPCIKGYTMQAIIRAERVFMIPGIVLLLAGGIGAAIVGGYPILRTGWLLWGTGAFVLSGIAFGPLSVAQRAIAAAANAGNESDYERASQGWMLWGTLALVFPVLAFVIMILKPPLPAFQAAALAAAAPHCWIYDHIYPPTDAAFKSQHVTAAERTEIEKWAALSSPGLERLARARSPWARRLSASEQHLVRWMRAPFTGDVLVFVARPIEKSPSGAYSPWVALNANVLINPITCEVGAYPTA
jgi:uncharacterized membrane protein